MLQLSFLQAPSPSSLLPRHSHRPYLCGPRRCQVIINMLMPLCVTLTACFHTCCTCEGGEGGTCSGGELRRGHAARGQGTLPPAVHGATQANRFNHACSPSVSIPPHPGSARRRKQANPSPTHLHPRNPSPGEREKKKVRSRLQSATCAPAALTMGTRTWCCCCTSSRCARLRLHHCSGWVHGGRAGKGGLVSTGTVSSQENGGHVG